MRAMMALVEERSGVGELILEGQPLRQVRYRINRYQGMIEGSGLPIPGLHRIEGYIEFDAARDSAEWIGAFLYLKLEDGRLLGITLADKEGRILSEGHGPSKCQCC